MIGACSMHFMVKVQTVRLKTFSARANTLQKEIVPLTTHSQTEIMKLNNGQNNNSNNGNERSNKLEGMFTKNGCTGTQNANPIRNFHHMEYSRNQPGDNISDDLQFSPVYC